MSSENHIKTTNRKTLIGYLFLNVFLFSFLSKVFTITIIGEGNFWSQIFNAKYGLILLVFVLSLILEGLISSNIKAILIFGKIKKPLPGSRAFSKIALEDQRVDFAALEKLFLGTLPNTPEEQNREWYKLYRKNSSKPMVFEVHKAFLLTRDIAAISLILIPIVFVGYILYSTAWIKAGIHILLILLVFIAAKIAAINYGNRFVANVLVEATQE